MKHLKSYVNGSVFLFLSLLLLASCGGGGGGYGSSSSTGTTSSSVQLVSCGTASATVDALVSSFSPTGTAITVNQVVQWTNNSGVAHTVTRTTQPAGGTFDVALNNGTSVCLKFTASGVFDYFCKIHGITMNGSVTVNP